MGASPSRRSARARSIQSRAKDSRFSRRVYATVPAGRRSICLDPTAAEERRMNPIADHIRAHLAAPETSMRALSVELGQGEKFIADILSGKSKRPTPRALSRLSAVIGVDLAALPVYRQVSAADMLRRLREQPPADW